LESRLALAQADVDERWHYYEQLVDVERSIPVDEHDIREPGIEEPGIREPAQEAT